MIIMLVLSAESAVLIIFGTWEYAFKKKKKAIVNLKIFVLKCEKKINESKRLSANSNYSKSNVVD